MEEPWVEVPQVSIQGVKFTFSIPEIIEWVNPKVPAYSLHLQKHKYEHYKGL